MIRSRSTSTCRHPAWRLARGCRDAPHRRAPADHDSDRLRGSRHPRRVRSTPAEAVAVPLAATLRDFQMVVLDKCGHDPWRERWAVDKFYELLDRQLIS